MKRAISLLLVLAFIVSLSQSITHAKLVACVGDSDTYGAGLPDRAYNCYPAQLERLLRQLDIRWETRNFGVNGAGVLRKGSRPYVVQSAFNTALACEPDAVVINLGWNDSVPTNWVHKDDFVTDFLFLIDAFARLPSQPKIYVCHPIPESLSPWHTSRTIRDEVNPLIDHLPTLRDVQVIDLYGPLDESLHLFQPDRIHLSVEGTKLMAEIIAATLTGVRTLPDFNGDGVVGSDDVRALVEHWHTEEPAYDIAPPPFGDGLVDVQDLIALAEYLLTYPGAVAYWKLDETEGIVAGDSTGNNDGYVHGAATWEPNEGQVGGALKFNGVDAYVDTDLLLDPANGPFSVLVWVKGGAPGEVIISQGSGRNWLVADTVDGSLRTDLRTPETTGRGAMPPGPPLISPAVITDGDWHRVAFVRDATSRILYVDGIEVARDAAESLESADGGLYIGAGSGLELGTFFSGLIDDVRVYNRAVHP